MLDQIAECEVIGFNLAFDWFHLCKIYTIFDLLSQRCGPDAFPDEHIRLIADELEESGRDGKCFKPRSALDLMLHARKTEFQITMERSDIRIRRVPTKLAWALAKKLEAEVELESILFARGKNKLSPKWKVNPVKDNDDFKDIVLKFKPSMALKNLAYHVLKEDDIILFDDIAVDPKFLPAEVGYAPFAAAIKR